MRAHASVTTPEQYITSLPDARRDAVRQLHDLIRNTVPKLKPVISTGMLGYGPYHYRYASGREGDAAVVGLAAQKNYYAIYVCAADAKGYVAEQYREALPKADVGKSCVRFERIEDVDFDVLRRLLKHAERAGGMGHVATRSGDATSTAPGARGRRRSSNVGGPP